MKSQDVATVQKNLNKSAGDVREVASAPLFQYFTSSL